MKAWTGLIRIQTTMHKIELAFAYLRRVCFGLEAPEHEHLYVKEVEHRLKSPGRLFHSFSTRTTLSDALTGKDSRSNAQSTRIVCLQTSPETEPQQIKHNSRLSMNVDEPMSRAREALVLRCGRSVHRWIHSETKSFSDFTGSTRDPLPSAAGLLDVRDGDLECPRWEAAECPAFETGIETDASCHHGSAGRNGETSRLPRFP